jgi:LPXTG-motif cell wall-anchored protein
MSADGTRIAIGAPGNDGSGSGTGHVRIYTWDGTTWTQTGADINGEADGEYSGSSVAMSADGTRIAIGATGNNDNGSNAGQVLIYTWDGTTWTQTGADINGEADGDQSGYSVAMSADGTRIAIGALYNDDNGNDAGQVRIYSVPAAPTAPTISSVIAANGSLTVAFTAGTDGGSPITNYKYSIDGTNYVALNPAATTSPFTISGLTNGTSYSVSIKAVNEIGDSIASNAVAGIPVAPTATTTTTVALIATVPVLETVKKADSLPKTGDNSSRVVMIGLLFTMTGLVLTSRRRIKQ